MNVICIYLYIVIHPNKPNEICQGNFNLNKKSMFIKRTKSKRWLVNIQFQHEKIRKQCDKYKDDFKEATGAGVEEEDHA